MLNKALHEAERQGLPLTAENVASLMVPTLMHKERIITPDEDERRIWAESEALRIAQAAQKPETYDMERNPERTSLSMAGPWLDMGIDLRKEGHPKTRIYLKQAIGRVQAAGLRMTIENFDTDYVNNHYSPPDLEAMTPLAINGYNRAWSRFKRLWPTNTESNPWQELLPVGTEIVLPVTSTDEGEQAPDCDPTPINTVTTAPEIPTGPTVIGIAGTQVPLTVGQTISYLEAALIGNPAYAGMVVTHIRTEISPNSGDVVRIITLDGTGGGSPPSTLPTNAPTEPINIMLLPADPELLPGMTISPALSVELAQDFRYMGMTVDSVYYNLRRTGEDRDIVASRTVRAPSRWKRHGHARERRC